MIEKPQESLYLHDEYLRNYVESVAGNDALSALEAQKHQVLALYTSLSNEQALYRYGEGKWTLKEVLGHIVDTERIMAYRTLCFSRGEEQSLPGFDQDEYVATATFNDRSLDNLLREYRAVRESTIALLESFSGSTLEQRGKANQKEFSVRSLIWVLAGHEAHHLKIIRARYLNK